MIRCLFLPAPCVDLSLMEGELQALVSPSIETHKGDASGHHSSRRALALGKVR